jgi:hypothetical protein
MSEQTIQQAKTDPGWVEVWRERPGDYYADSVSVHPERRAVRVNANGYVRTHPFEGQSAGETPAPQEPTEPSGRTKLTLAVAKKITRLEAENTRLRAALEEISRELPCDRPCRPERPPCETCGHSPVRVWCAGCVARAALKGDPTV